MPLIPCGIEWADRLYSQSLVDGIVVGGTDKHTADAHTPLEGISVVNIHDIPVKREFQSANKFLTI